MTDKPSGPAPAANYVQLGRYTKCAHCNAILENGTFHYCGAPWQLRPPVGTGLNEIPQLWLDQLATPESPTLPNSANYMRVGERIPCAACNSVEDHPTKGCADFVAPLSSREGIEKVWYVEQAKDALTRNGTNLESFERQAFGALIEVVEGRTTAGNKNITDLVDALIFAVRSRTLCDRARQALDEDIEESGNPEAARPAILEAFTALEKERDHWKEMNRGQVGANVGLVSDNVRLEAEAKESWGEVIRSGNREAFLTERCSVLEADAKRLDWMIDGHKSCGRCEVGKQVWYSVWNCDGDEIAHADTPRSALDAAMGEDKS